MSRCIEQCIGGEMKNIGSIGITAIPLLSSFLLMGAASSVMFESSDDLSMDAEQIVNGVLDEITTYLKIEDTLGKYYNNNGTRRVEKIVILVKPLIKSTINVSELTIKIRNNDDVILLSYSGYAVKSDSEGIFENWIWDETINVFSVIVVLDKDRSLLDYNVMNEDRAFIAVRLPDSFCMNDDETITTSIIPSKGIIRTIVLETPSFHSSDIISFGDV